MLLPKGFRERTHAGNRPQMRTRPYRPQTNGTVERFNPARAAEWAYADTYTGGEARPATYDDWLLHYNHHRVHTGIGGLTHIERLRVHNLPRNYT